jgi:GNAT superfamily N-acetyltransferase
MRGFDIRLIGSSELEKHLPALAALLIDAVDDGASVGFLPPLSQTAAVAYWKGVHVALRSFGRVLLAAFEDDVLVGSVQLQCADMPNSLHRAEVMKLFVLRRARRSGIARALMLRIQECALKYGRSLLIADTRVGSSAEKLCEQLGYVKVGIIPKYVRSANGNLDGTLIMYRWMEVEALE